MSETIIEKESENFWQNPLAIAFVFALVKLALHFAFNSNYGYFRDELYFIACSEHLAFGYPDHAPLIAFTTKLSRILFGDSLFAIRLFSALAGAAKVFLTGLLVRELGGKRFAVFLACLCVLCAPIYLAIDNLLSMNSFEPLFWTGCAYFAVLAIKKENLRYWLWFGVCAGLSLLNKHSMVFFGLAIIVGLILTDGRKVFLNKCIWIAGAIAFSIFLPNLIWQYENNWATIELLQNVQKSGKNVVLSPLDFISSQIFMLLPTTAPIWIAGIWYFLADRNGRKFRFLGICYLILLALMIFLKAKDYYLAPVYPILFAAGAVWFEQIAEQIRKARF
ncbi:MAG: glycosyltransferase family 39 protein, partial [Acidobacteria bacterium]|nr:glycosyltransferase family 39 protein [Acidobacteriota bacterium]MCA1638370.1 glycosyltransferase family 39 protein [Acidobacteriota bacterium]